MRSPSMKSVQLAPSTRSSTSKALRGGLSLWPPPGSAPWSRPSRSKPPESFHEMRSRTGSASRLSSGRPAAPDRLRVTARSRRVQPTTIFPLADVLVKRTRVLSRQVPGSS